MALRDLIHSSLFVQIFRSKINRIFFPACDSFMNVVQLFVYWRHSAVYVLETCRGGFSCSSTSVGFVGQTNDQTRLSFIWLIFFFFFMQTFYRIVVFLQCRLRTTCCPNQNIQFGVIREMNHILQLKIYDACFFLQDCCLCSLRGGALQRANNDK